MSRIHFQGGSFIGLSRANPTTDPQLLADLGAEGLGGLLNQSAVQFEFHVADRADAAVAVNAKFL